jgi:tRNA nucleotidyltransferase (CCA-adding enzyme)
MPTVALPSIKLDLFRRDFTINTLAVRLDPDGFGTMIDFFGGQRDIKDGVIRVLHSLSFIEDPTRVFRAVRFEQRYGFRIGKHTLNLIKNAVRLNIFSRLSGRRLERELRLILQEQDPRPAVERCAEIDILQFIHTALKLTQKERRLLDSTYDVLAWYRLLFRPEPVRQWMLYLFALLSGLNDEDYEACINRLGYPGSIRKVVFSHFMRGRKALAAIEAVRRGITASQVCSHLRGLEPEIVLHLLAVTENKDAGYWISKYITGLQDVGIEVTGDDLLNMGIEPGPVYREIFSELLNARLDGRVSSREEEMELAAELAGK